MPGPKITALEVGQVRAEISDTDGMTFKQVCEQMGVHTDGRTVIVNGRRLSDDEVATQTVSPDDDIRVSDKADAGR